MYQAEIRDELPLDALESRRQHGWSNSEQAENPLPEGAIAYARDLILGVQERSAEIDFLINQNSDRWALGRMPVVDKNVLRIGVFELLWRRDVPVAVVINEAVELAKQLSTEESGRFVNGLLGKVAADAREGDS